MTPNDRLLMKSVYAKLSSMEAGFEITKHSLQSMNQTHGSEIRQLKSDLAETKAELQTVQMELAHTIKRLNAAESELVGSNSKLVASKSELSHLRAWACNVSTEVNVKEPSDVSCEDDNTVLTANSEGDAIDEDEISPYNRMIALPYAGKPFDTNGLMYFIGTRGKTAAYMNPHKLQHTARGKHVPGVTVTMSTTLGESAVFRFVNHKKEENNYTNDECNSWMKVDIGENRRMQVDQYCLRHGTAGSSGALRHWRFEGSHTGGNNAEEWITLRAHRNDKTISVVQNGGMSSSGQSSPYAVGSWVVSVAAASLRFRYFRIIQTNANSSWDHCLNCSGIELYGVLETTHNPA